MINFSTIVSSFSAWLNLLNFSRENKKRTVEALTALQLAIIQTRKQILENGYQPNTELSKLWLTAFEKVSNAHLLIEDDEPTSYLRLYYKARFWADPQFWLRESSSMELIPKLVELEIHCENVIAKVENM